MEQIQSITEAYSMQPKSFFANGNIKEIKLETVFIGPEPIMMYVGYDLHGNKSFQYLANSVNVHFKP